MDIKAIYSRMTQKREDFLTYAHDTAMLCDPSLSPKGDKIRARPQAIVGIQAVRSLASSLQKSMFAAGVKPFKLDLSPEVWNKLKAIGKVGGTDMTADQFIRSRLEKREDDCMKSLELKTSRSRFAKVIRRNLIEGTNAFINYPDAIRAYPLRCLVVERESGVVRLLILELVMDVDPLDQDVAADKKDEKITRYILVNFEKMEVWQQDVPKDQEGDRPKATQIDQPKRTETTEGPQFDWTGVLTANQFIVPVNEIPDIDGDDYAPGYAYNFLNGFSFINHGEMSLSEAMAAAAWNRPRVKPGSPVSENLRAFFEGRSGEPWLGDEGDVEWLSAAQKIGDWAFVVQLLQRKELGLAAAFAMGLKDRLVSSEMTATEVLQIIDELNTQTHDLVGTLEETLLMPLIRSELELLERFDPLGQGLAPEAQELIRPVITTGTSAIEKQRWTERFITLILPSIQKMDSTLRVNGEAIAKYQATTGRNEAVLSFFRTASPQELLLEAQMQSGAMTAPPANQPRTDTVLTNGGPQPPQPAQSAA